MVVRSQLHGMGRMGAAQTTPVTHPSRTLPQVPLPALGSTRAPRAAAATEARSPRQTRRRLACGAPPSGWVCPQCARPQARSGTCPAARLSSMAPVPVPRRARRELPRAQRHCHLPPRRCQPPPRPPTPHRTSGTRHSQAFATLRAAQEWELPSCLLLLWLLPTCHLPLATCRAGSTTARAMPRTESNGDLRRTKTGGKRYYAKMAFVYVCVPGGVVGCNYCVVPSALLRPAAAQLATCRPAAHHVSSSSSSSSRTIFFFSIFSKFWGAEGCDRRTRNKMQARGEIAVPFSGMGLYVVMSGTGPF